VRLLTASYVRLLKTSVSCRAGKAYAIGRACLREMTMAQEREIPRRIWKEAAEGFGVR
jgi:hypothetical protein